MMPAGCILDGVGRIADGSAALEHRHAVWRALETPTMVQHSRRVGPGL